MPTIIGIRFKRAGKIYHFDPSGLELAPGDVVIVDTARGLELGRVVTAPQDVQADQLVEPLKPVVRRAEAEELEQVQELPAQEMAALEKCRQAVARFKLPMKLLSAEYSFDRSRLTVFFSAPGRVDFRELVRELSAIFKARVELRQVGPRDEAKLLGDLGKCGRPLCCAHSLAEFSPVSIRMAKQQDLPLNPMKISGVCGRLLCCLAYENEQYRLLKEKLPSPGQWLNTPLGLARVVGGNPLKETVLVQLESQATVELPLSQLTRQEPRPERLARRRRR
ncbi:MAG TPA: stage 0 sporulation family protein [Dehalococcoidia bacterium]|jgi:cell fate regulator YaaT (PSP1 superfamily)|nr:stage 0 sporulation family protein [Dehalococcoidia bacterium]